MTYTPRTTEEAARHTVDGLTDDLLGLINPANDGMLAAWQMALERGKEIVMALETGCKAIAARPVVNGNTALRAIADEPPFSEEPFAADIAQTIAARKARGFKVGDRVRISDECTVWQGASNGVIALIDEDPSGCNLRVDLDVPFGSLTCLWVYPEMLAHADAIPVASPEEEVAFTEFEAEEQRQAERAECLKPEVFDIVGFTQKYFMGKGA